MAELLLDSSSLKPVLDKLAQPGSLQNHAFLQSWVVQEFLADMPESESCTTEYLIGQALERQLQQWSGEFRFDAAYRKAWMEIFCLKAAYFRHLPGLSAYQKRPTLKQLSVTFSDMEELSRLVPGREHEAEALLDAPELKGFWYALGPKTDQGVGTSTIDQLLRRAIANFADWLESRRTLKTTPSRHHGTSRPEEANGAANAARLYREQVFPPTLPFVPEEWQRLLDNLPTEGLITLRDRAGTGKTHLLYALGAHIHQGGKVPLYVYLPDYAPFSAEMDILQFAATQGSFGQRFRDEQLRVDFEKALAQAQKRGHLVVLADGGDDLCAYEVVAVAARLRGFQRLVLVERWSRLPLERNEALILKMPSLSGESIAALLAACNGTAHQAEPRMAELQYEGLADNLELLLLASAMTHNNPLVYSAHVVGAWIARRLERARTSGSVVDEPCKARRLLGLLAIAQVDRIVDSENHPRFTREELRTVFWTMLIKPEKEDEGWLVVEHCERAGLLVRLPSKWQFAYPALAKWFCAEQLIEQERYWVSWGLKYQPLLQWTAALLAQGADSFHAQRFCQRMLATLPSRSDLSWLELADVLTQFHDQFCPAIAEVRVQLQAKLRSLAQLDGDRLTQAVRERATRLGLDVGLSVLEQRSTESYVLPDLDREAQDLAGLLQLRLLTAPHAARKDWLEDRRVLRGLMHTLCSVSTTELKWRCAAWLRRSSLSRTLQTKLIPLRRWPAWEVLAQIACDAQQERTTRMAAQSVLTRDDLLLALWQRGEAYRALVYELLLMNSKRLHCVYPTSQWELVE